jgi:hypothetical protein
MVFKIFSPKNSAKILAFFTQNKAKLCKILIVTLVFKKNANFFAENCRKSQKIVIITSTPDALNTLSCPIIPLVANVMGFTFEIDLRSGLCKGMNSE